MRAIVACRTALLGGHLEACDTCGERAIPTIPDVTAIARSARREPDLSPDALITNAVQRSGVLTFVPDLYDPLAGALHLPRFAKFQDLNPLETLAGPSFGTGAALLDTVRRLTKGNISAADLHKLRQLFPTTTCSISRVL